MRTPRFGPKRARSVATGGFYRRNSLQCAPVESIFLESWAKPLLVAHAVTAVALAGSVGHLGYECWKVLRGRVRNAWLLRVHARVGFALYVLQFVIGALAYPTYRVRVRHEYFDVKMPWLTNLFDVKEMWAAFGLAAFAAVFAMSFALRPEAPDQRPLSVGFASLGLLVTAIVAFATVSGFLIVSYRSI